MLARETSPIGPSSGISSPATLSTPSRWLGYTLRWPTIRYAVHAQRAAYTPMSVGSSSMPITAAAIGVFAAAPSTATKPNAANIGAGNPRWPASAAPRVVPIKKIGVTMPQLPPDSNVIAVAAILMANAKQGELYRTLHGLIYAAYSPSPAYRTPNTL